MNLSGGLKCIIVITCCPTVVLSSWTFIFSFSRKFSSETAEWNSMGSKKSRSSTMCVFRVDQKTKIAALASDWRSIFLLLCWTVFYEIKQEAGGPWLSGRSLASGLVGPGIEPLPGYGWCGRQASLTIALYRVHSLKVFLILKVGQQLHRAYVHC